jgi:hypothetical protein
MDLPDYPISLCSNDGMGDDSFRSGIVNAIKLWLLQLLLQKVFGLTLELIPI